MRKFIIEEYDNKVIEFTPEIGKWYSFNYIPGKEFRCIEHKRGMVRLIDREDNITLLKETYE